MFLSKLKLNHTNPIKCFMELIELIKSLVHNTKTLDIEQFPSRGLFYPDDFSVKIKRADQEKIIEYESNFQDKDLFSIINSIKKIVDDHTIWSSEYNFKHLKVIDLVWVFLEIVKFTTGKKIHIPYFDQDNSLVKEVEINTENFNYFNFDKYKKDYNSTEKNFYLDGYRFSLPSIGVETDLIKFLNSKTAKKNWKNLSEMNYNFIFFLGTRDSLTKKEIENLLTIFNEDIPASEIEKINQIIVEFSKSIKYTLKIGKKIVDLQSKLELKDIFK